MKLKHIYSKYSNITHCITEAKGEIWDWWMKWKFLVKVFFQKIAIVEAAFVKSRSRISQDQGKTQESRVLQSLRRSWDRVQTKSELSLYSNFIYTRIPFEILLTNPSLYRKRLQTALFLAQLSAISPQQNGFQLWKVTPNAIFILYKVKPSWQKHGGSQEYRESLRDDLQPE